MEKLLGSLPPWLPASIHAWYNLRWGWGAALLLLLYAAGGAISQETDVAPSAADAVPSGVQEVGGVADIQAARQAYWQGRLEEAERLYQALAKQAPDDPDVAGELGNIYWQQGKQEVAFGTYFEAASRLYRRQQQQQAWDLLTFVSLAQWLKQGQVGEMLCQQLKAGKEGS